jgi:hypothetical protein
LILNVSSLESALYSSLPSLSTLNQLSFPVGLVSITISVSNFLFTSNSTYSHIFKLSYLDLNLIIFEITSILSATISDSKTHQTTFSFSSPAAELFSSTHDHRQFPFTIETDPSSITFPSNLLAEI